MKSLSAFTCKPKVNIFLASNTAQKKPDYTIEGSFLAKKCLIYFGEELVTEVRGLGIAFVADHADIAIYRFGLVS